MIPLEGLIVTLHSILGLIQISRYGYFHGPGREMNKNHWNVSEISPTHREKSHSHREIFHAVKKVMVPRKMFHTVKKLIVSVK